jgi:hypothetical protein
LTVWPTVAVTVLTGHVSELLPDELPDELPELLLELLVELLELLLELLDEPPPPDVVPLELTTSGVTPNLRP